MRMAGGAEKLRRSPSLKEDAAKLVITNTNVVARGIIQAESKQRGWSAVERC